MILKYDRTLKIVRYKILEYDNQFVMIWYCTYIWDQNIVECYCLILYAHKMW